MCTNNYRKDKLCELCLRVNIATIYKSINGYVYCKLKKIIKIKFEKVLFIQTGKIRRIHACHIAKNIFP